ncbi:MAG: response regulator [Proteobacteria bacterium]|nr:response regulator [Pseudomonadota bacterium]
MKFRLSLRDILTFLFVFIGVLPLLVIGYITMHVLTRSLTQEISRKNFVLARSLAGEVTLFLQEPLNLLKQLGSVSEEAGLIEPDQMNRYIGVLAERYRFFNMILVLDRQGRVRHMAPFSPNYQNINLLGQPFVQTALDLGRPSWSTTFISARTGEVTLALASPMADGLAVGYIDLAAIKQIVDRVSISGQGFAAVIDRDGTVIAHPLADMVARRVNVKDHRLIRRGLSGWEGTLQYRHDSKDLLGGAAGIPGTGWLVVVLQPIEEAYAPVVRVRELFLSGALIVFLAALFVARAIIRRTLDPLEHLMTHAGRIAEGDYQIRPLGRSYPELEKLAEDFTVMSDAIQTREAQLRNSEARYRLLVENAPLGILSVDRQGRIMDLNKKLAEILGSPSLEETRAINMLTFAPLAESGVVEHFRQCLENGESGIFETPYTSKWAKEVFLRYHLRPITDDQGLVRGVQGIVEDVSEAKRLETQLRQSQKMEAIGTLAGGIAHDFNNILAIILGFTEMALTNPDLGDKPRRNLENVLQAGRRARDLVQQILTFSRQARTDPKPLDLAPLLDEALRFLRASLPATIEIRPDIRTEPAVILGDGTQIHQLLINLCTNAAQALGGSGGRIDVSLDRMDGDIAPDEQPEGLGPGPHVRLTVRDDGPGMDMKVLPRIFEPFFTTKATGEGTGMGLSVVHGIVRGHGGAIRVTSRPGRGAAFHVYFPAIDGRVDRETDRIGPLARGSERILFVDDEAQIADLGRALMERLGYRVVSSRDPLQALSLFRERPDEFDLVVTDMTMPGMTGDRLGEEIMRIRPELPVILCTGFNETMSESKARRLGMAAFVLKPLTLEELARVIRRTLDRSPADQSSNQP